MTTESLNGKWRLYFYRHGSLKTENPRELAESGQKSIEAIVPGETPLDLSRAGILPKDLFFGENIKEIEKYEDYEWWYETEFVAPEGGERVSLCFDGVDCIAQYWLNDVKIGESDNMLIGHSFDVSDTLLRGEKNKLFVRLLPAMYESASKNYDLYNLVNSFQINEESIYIRKAPHSFGWDIMPRCVSAGIWKDVYLRLHDETEFEQAYLFTKELTEEKAKMCFVFDVSMPPVGAGHTLCVRLTGVCGDSTFEVESDVFFKAGHIEFEIEKPLLWWPRGYGEANLYDVRAEFYLDGALCAEKTLRTGIRTVKLKTSYNNDTENDFRVLVNNVFIMCKGSNWVPMDAFHSREAQRYDRAISLVKDIGCNILRCWGGNVYEREEFFNLCDENGIMVWQDFAMACHTYPQDESFCKTIEREAVWVVRTLRQHPSIIIWAGDNEVDEATATCGTNPDGNVITRRILPEVIRRNDIGRPYIPSSPYISGEMFESGSLDNLPERHLWGARDYFKSDFYMNSKASFVSEEGYHGCPCVETVKKFTRDAYSEEMKSGEWILHSSDRKGDNSRLVLMTNQVKQLFSHLPEDFEEFALASQISQAEAKKVFIERVRINKPKKTGIIWWNLLDGWPQFSDAVVDWYFEKKLAYHYIKCSQQPFVIMADETRDWQKKIVASNDTLKRLCGTYSVADGETGEVLLAGEYSVSENSNAVLGEIPVMYSEKKLLLISWQGDAEGANHYVCGYTPFELETYKRWLEKIKSCFR